MLSGNTAIDFRWLRFKSRLKHGQAVDVKPCLETITPAQKALSRPITENFHLNSG